LRDPRPRESARRRQPSTRAWRKGDPARAQRQRARTGRFASRSVWGAASVPALGFEPAPGDLAKPEARRDLGG
jgi:hypothetical protein